MKTYKCTFLLALLFCCCTANQTPTNGDEDSVCATTNDEDCAANYVQREEENNDLPTQQEIDEVNKKLPVEVTPGVLFTRVDYDKVSKIQTFKYRHTVDVDRSLLTEENISILRQNVILHIKASKGSVKRISAGAIYHYKYYSRENELLYVIKVDKSDL